MGDSEGKILFKEGKNYLLSIRSGCIRNIYVGVGLFFACEFTKEMFTNSLVLLVLFLLSCSSLNR